MRPALPASRFSLAVMDAGSCSRFLLLIAIKSPPVALLDDSGAVRGLDHLSSANLPSATPSSSDHRPLAPHPQLLGTARTLTPSNWTQEPGCPAHCVDTTNVMHLHSAGAMCARCSNNERARHRRTRDSMTEKPALTPSHLLISPPAATDSHWRAGQHLAAHVTETSKAEPSCRCLAALIVSTPFHRGSEGPNAGVRRVFHTRSFRSFTSCWKIWLFMLTAMRPPPRGCISTSSVVGAEITENSLAVIQDGRSCFVGST